jgi:hypothetical protein
VVLLADIWRRKINTGHGAGMFPSSAGYFDLFHSVS